MRKLVPLAVIMSGAALLAACGSSGKQTATPQASTNAQYLPIYKGIRSQLPANFKSRKVDTGVPFVIPNVARILAPAQLEAAIKDTKEVSINGNYIGKNLTPNQRMAIYSAKMFMYIYDLSLPQYLYNTPVAKTALRELSIVGGPFYGAARIPAFYMNPYNLRSLMDGYANLAPLLGRWTYFAPTAKGSLIPVANMPSALVPNKNRVCFRELIPSRSTYGGYNDGGYGPVSGPAYNFACMTAEPGEWRHVWRGLAVTTTTFLNNAGQPRLLPS